MSLKNFLRGVYYVLYNSLACREDYQTGSQGFYFPCCSILQRNFPNSGMEILALGSAKSFPGLYFCQPRKGLLE